MSNTYKQLNRLIAAQKDLVQCTHSYVNFCDCSWYHKNWLDFRYLEMVSNPFWHKDFFSKNLYLYASPSTDILIIGTADFSMPLLCHELGLKNIDICDICHTPLNYCKVAALLLDCHWNIFQHNVLDSFHKKYDIIINDAFLTRFNNNDKSQVLKSIASTLHVNGFYITTVRKGISCDEQALRPSYDQKIQFIRRAEQLSKQKDIMIKDISSKASMYIENMISYPIPSIEKIQEILPPSLIIDHYNECIVEGECEPTTYFEIVFKKIIF